MSRVELLLRDLQVRLNQRIQTPYRKVSVSGYYKNGNMSLVLAIFRNHDYMLEFPKDKNIPLNLESESYTKYIESIVARLPTYFKPE